MQMTSKTYKYNLEQTSFALMKISVFMGLFSHCFQNYLGSLSVTIYLAILFFGYAGILFFIFGGNSKSVYTTTFSILVVYFCVIGLFRGNLSNFTIAVVQDLRYVMYFLMGSIFAQNDRYMADFHSVMKKVGLIALVLGIYAIITFPFGSIEGREATWTDHYYLWWASASSFAYLGAYALVTKKNRIIGLGTFAVFFILGMLFLKRSALVDVVVILLLSMVIQSSKPMRNFVITIAGVSLFIIILERIAPGYFALTETAIYDRFDDIESVADIDRNVEAQLYLQNSSTVDKLLGFGIFNYPDIIIPGDPKNALHLGWANILFKGGLLYALWYIWLYRHIIRNIFYIKNGNELFRVCLIVAMSSLISLLFEGSWTYTILPFCISAPIFYAARKIA